MSAGFECIGTHGVTQIDQNWINMVFVQKGTVAIATASTDRTDSEWFSISYTGVSPIVFFKSSTFYIFPTSVVRSGSTWTWKFFAAADSVNLTEVVTYYIFDKQANIETRSGLNVYDQNGVVTFNSDYRPLRIVAIVNTTFNQTTANPQTSQTVSGGSGVYAATLPSPGFIARKLSTTSGYYYTQGYRLPGGSLFQTGTYNSSGPPVGGGIGGGMGIVVDVGGL